MDARHRLSLNGSPIRSGKAWLRAKVRPRAARGAEQGQGMLEYAIICGAIIVGTAAVLTGLSGSLNRIFSTISATLGQY